MGIRVWIVEYGEYSMESRVDPTLRNGRMFLIVIYFFVIKNTQTLYKKRLIFLLLVK